MPQKLALLVGVDKYKDPKFTELSVPLVDVEALGRVLEDPGICAFDQVDILPNPSKGQVERQVEELFAKRKRNDLILLYFSGHGIRDAAGELYLALGETELGLLKSTAVPSFFLNTVMNDSRSKRQVLILDCCHSGAFEPGGKGAVGAPAITETNFEVKGYGRTVLASSGETQLSWEGDEIIGETDCSLFTHYLVEGLETGEAAEAGKEEITVSELYDYAFDHVVKATPKQKPQRWLDKGQGAMIIARNPHPVVVAKSLPAKHLKDLKSPNPALREGVVLELKRILQRDDQGLALAAENTLRKKIKTERDWYVRHAIEAAIKVADEQKSAARAAEAESAGEKQKASKVTAEPEVPAEPEVMAEPEVLAEPEVPAEATAPAPSGQAPQAKPSALAEFMKRSRAAGHEAPKKSKQRPKADIRKSKPAKPATTPTPTPTSHDLPVWWAAPKFSFMSLRHYKSDTILKLVAVVAAVLLWVFWLNPVGGYDYYFWDAAGIAGAVVGFIVGLGQLLTLRAVVTKTQPWKWLAASTIGWGVGSVIVTYIFYIMYEDIGFGEMGTEGLTLFFYWSLGAICAAVLQIKLLPIRGGEVAAWLWANVWPWIVGFLAAQLLASLLRPLGISIVFFGYGDIFVYLVFVGVVLWVLSTSAIFCALSKR